MGDGNEVVASQPDQVGPEHQGQGCEGCKPGAVAPGPPRLAVGQGVQRRADHQIGRRVLGQERRPERRPEGRRDQTATAGVGLLPQSHIGPQGQGQAGHQGRVGGDEQG